MAEPMRLQKLLSRAGAASRREGERLIQEGRVRVNGEVVRELGTRVDAARDRVTLDGREVRISPPLWVALHKPPGYVTSRRDPRGRRTVYHLLPEGHSGLFYVGRLDLLSEGLLLLTNQGDIAHRLMHPSFEVERVYDVLVEGDPDERTLRRLESGVELEDGVSRARRVERRETKRADRARLRLTLTEGRKREVRRMLDAVGHRVARLRRVRYGPVRLEGLEPGQWRELTGEETRSLARLVGLGGEGERSGGGARGGGKTARGSARRPGRGREVRRSTRREET